MERQVLGGGLESLQDSGVDLRASRGKGGYD